MTLDLTTVVLVWLLGCWVGWRVHRAWWHFNLSQRTDQVRALLDQLDSLEREDADTTATPLRVEQVDQQIFLYDHNTSEFLAQGATLQEALDRVSKLYPHRDFRGQLTAEQAAKYGVTADH